MNPPARINLTEWGNHYIALQKRGMQEPWYGGLLMRHVDDGNTRLHHLLFDNSPAALRLWNFLLTEEERLFRAREEGKTIIGTMKDLGTIPVIAFSVPNMVAFYPDGAWWIPCIMEQSDRLLARADALGMDESFCPVRAMVGAFQSDEHFPNPDLLICSTGAVCDDFSAIAQRLESLGYPIFWWEIPTRRVPEDGEKTVLLPNGYTAPCIQVNWVQSELKRVTDELNQQSSIKFDTTVLQQGITKANFIRHQIRELRDLVYGADPCPFPALEMLIIEALAIHFCSDQEECINVLNALLQEIRYRVKNHQGVLSDDAAKIFWLNPPADLRIMNLMESCGGRLCGADFMFLHALETIPTDCHPLEALARTALTDSMVGSSQDRAKRICQEVNRYAAEAVVISRIPGASHCAWESEQIHEYLQNNIRVPILEIEIPCLIDSMEQTFCTRLQALVETVKHRRL